MKKYILLIFLIFCTILSVAQQEFNGTVVSSSGHAPLPGANVQVKGSNIHFITDSAGHFHSKLQGNPLTIQISYIGFRSLEIIVNLPTTSLIIALEPNSNVLNEVTVSTGYQDLPSERATGSFTKVDNPLINRSVSTDIVSRLQDVTSGLIFNRGKGAVKNDISIRGLSTIFGNAQPLVVVDNFPYNGDLTNINPNDVESITILKDAAAASIWGSRAGNGVIVITTKKGKNNQPLRISFNANINIVDKPNLLYKKMMSSADYITTEERLYSEGYYQNTISAYNAAVITPVLELLNAESNGTINAAQAKSQISGLKNQDIRNDLAKYFFQKSINQQYSINFSGGSENQQYYVSGGYDKNLDNLVGNGYDRLTLNANNTYNLFNKKLEVRTGIYITQSKTTTDNPGIEQITYNGSSLYPYARLADSQGNPLAINKDYRDGFIQSAQNSGFLDWTYKPLDEIQNANNTSSITDYKLNAGLKYRYNADLNAQILYQYQRSGNEARNLQSQNTYYTRNLINQYTQVNPDGSLTLPMPLGGIYDFQNSTGIGQDLRAQLNYHKSWNNKNELAAIGGYEMRALHTTGSSYRLYGYDPVHETSQAVNFLDYYTLYNDPYIASTISYSNGQTNLHDNYRSYYFNGSYTFDKRYTLSGSIRQDASNLFGVKTNQKAVPLFSTGLSWNITNESFYKWELIPVLKLRATYGYNGNVNKTVTAYTTAYYYDASQSGIHQPYATIINPPNPELRWERVQVTNLGVDFSSKNNIITGSIEYYRKDGKDLIGTVPYAPSTGILTFSGNTANTNGRGFDLILNTKNIDRELKWNTNFLLSKVSDKIIKYLYASPVSSLLQYGDGLSQAPLVGKPLYALYSYKWNGLDPATGDPQGYLNGQASKDYSAIISSATPDNIVYSGSARPTVFGSFRNTFQYKGFSISANITYRLGYYFRKSSIGYGSDYGLGGDGDYNLRWQKLGDEQYTYVPSIPNVPNNNRDMFYSFSSVLVQKADNIRLQDVNFSYDLYRQGIKQLPFRHIQFYVYANNLGLLWKTNKAGIDPDYQTGPPPKAMAFGIKTDF
ncbi:TonB-linked outer membrane protein, SusC/RagA family [Pedobacter westerhofensis]|uniref:TonB-linked outer membrane protein, SusC/RagA family n=1 Tax=Pedobacter westerhofensis TaxID=425512 RepID=A0A521DPR0_9SPHI|nr:SusC/RagA family TonB-linked outer membrane protein [Pedobacter westerhofensis]SMO73592.1 TonB-linked outer membrane protein, SusC/RagA family [Pedobacter westerhofensis]